VVPVTLSTPVCVIAPFAVTDSVPLTVEAPRASAIEFVRLTLFPLMIDTAPVKLLPKPSVMLFPAPPSASWSR